MDRHVPERDIRIKNTDAPHVSENTKAMMSQRRAALKSGDKENYRRLNKIIRAKIVRAAIRRDEREYIRRRVHEAEHSNMWKTVKHIVAPKCGSSSVELPVNLVEQANVFFAEVGHRTAESVRSASPLSE